MILHMGEQWKLLWRGIYCLEIRGSVLVTTSVGELAVGVIDNVSDVAAP